MADIVANEGFELGSSSVTTSGFGVGTPSSLTNWNQWSNSGPVSTQLSNAHVLEGSSSAQITGGLNDGLYQYGNFSPGFYTASAWFWVGSGAGELGLFYNGGSNGAFSTATTTVGAWEYVSQTNNLEFGLMGPVIYAAAPQSNIWVDAFWMNQGETSTSPFAPSNGFDPNLSAVPEPGTLALMALGLLGLSGLALVRKRRTRQA
jgi:hypothetical protein